MSIKLKVLIIAAVSALILIGAITFYLVNNPNSIEAPTETSETSEDTEENDENTFNYELYSLTDPESLWVIVNKLNGLPTDFVPELTVPDVRLRLDPSAEQMSINTQTATAIESMFKAAEQDGIHLVFGSGYRSADLQRQFYDSYVSRDGQEAADRYSARPGHSEHQTGFAVDITSADGSCHLQICWQDTKEGEWVQSNAHKFGFILRYMQGKEDITGYQYEPWHYRYVGKELAQKIHENNVTLEEFFDLPPAPNYQSR